MLAAAAAALVACAGQEAQQAPDRPDTDQQAQRAGGDRAQREDGDARGDAGWPRALVTDVIDGDTIELQDVGRVRITGVDTPERGEECYQEASEYLERRVGGQTVRYRYQQERTDRYGRALLDIFRDGQLVNLDIAEAGWGEELTIAPNDRYAERIAEAEADARAEPRGRWAGCSTQPEPDRESTPAPYPGNQDDDSGGGGSGGGGGSVPSGTCSEIGITDFPVAPGDPRDGDGDGIACES